MTHMRHLDGTSCLGKTVMIADGVIACLLYDSGTFLL
jgi:hypothetical protein